MFLLWHACCVCVFIRYSYDEAEGILAEQVEAAKAKVAEYTADLAFLRDQITTTEVNIARTYNYDILLRKQKAEEEQENAEIQKE